MKLSWCSLVFPEILVGGRNFPSSQVLQNSWFEVTMLIPSWFWEASKWDFWKKTYEIKEFFTPTPNMELLVRLGQCYDSHWYYNVSNLRPDENSSMDQNVTQVLCTTPIHTFFFIHFLSLSSTWTKWYVFIFSLSVFLLTIPGLGGTPTSLPNSVAPLPSFNITP